MDGEPGSGGRVEYALTARGHSLRDQLAGLGRRAAGQGSAGP
ncbi:hypothetical protein [Pseudonocardia sp. DLS-67]